MILKFFATLFWQYTPGYFQRLFSSLFSKFFFHQVSRIIIVPYCFLFGLTNDYIDQFESETGKVGYHSYSDFFKRKYKTPPPLEAEQVWPCEGYICDWGRFSEKNDSLVKGQKIDLNQIFNSPAETTQDYFFTNVFLHNHNYHRVHSPVSGEIKKISVIPGDLIFLRPWFYKRDDVSYPAFRNERVVFEIVDENNKSWFVALVGGFGVGT
ncbi:MAG: phosphatidylserine decarboxylase, partial [Pseudobdellovibrio sp.]